MQNRKTLIIIGFALIIAFVFFVLAARQQSKQERQQAFSDALSKGSALSTDESPEAIAELERALNLAEDKASEALTKLELGIAYQLQDHAKAVAILKEVVANDAYEDIHRAYAVNTILNLLIVHYGTEDSNFAKQYVFTDEEPWKSFKKEGVTEETVIKAYEWSNDLFSTSEASYQIARWYGRKLFEEKVFSLNLLNTNEKEMYRSKFSSHFEQGRALINSETETYIHYPFRYAIALELQGVLYAIDYVINDNPASKEKAAESYEKALKLLENNPTKYHRNAALEVKYFYAIWLSLLTSKGESREEAVKELVTAIMKEEERTLPFFEAFHRFKNDSIVLRYGKLIANVDPRFGNFLRDFGWDI